MALVHLCTSPFSGIRGLCGIGAFVYIAVLGLCGIGAFVYIAVLGHPWPSRH
ncbi:hypothetical protein [Teredinibacter franksiae]|uniref:hypothetical protein n=1 Tax=Teredinibacter franksiae TaxID=2761453 RepID=UPI0016245C57|nr:hypothetical protein [Teredinibacter franksiae]